MRIFRGRGTFIHMKVLIPVLCALLFISCLGVPSSTQHPRTVSNPSKEMPAQEKPIPLFPGSSAEIQKRLVEKALSLLGRTSLQFKGASFSSDCSGFVLAAYYLSGMDLRKEYAQKTGNGVRRLYQIAQSHRLLSTGDLPLAGDVLFWDNTYDANGDEKLNDELTHTGIVVAAFGDGRVDYAHYHVRRGIVVESMNLYQPGKESLNAPMRIKEAGKPRPDKWLAAQLYRSHARLWYLESN